MATLPLPRSPVALSQQITTITISIIIIVTVISAMNNTNIIQYYHYSSYIV